MNFQCLVVCASLLSACLGAELTFELSAHDRSCFSQELGGDVEVTLEYQVRRFTRAYLRDGQVTVSDRCIR